MFLGVLPWVLFPFCSEREAKVMKANSWLYHYYMVQSRLQYNLAYGGQPASIAAALYPQMMQHMMQSSGPTSPGGTPTGPPPPPGQMMSQI